MSQQKGKQGTKGSKQIVEENASTLKFYRYMAGGSTAITLLGLMIFAESFSIMMTILAIAIHIGSLQFMAMMCKHKLSETGAILDSGTDINMEGGIAEHVKDLIILTTGTQILTLFSNYFWLLLLLVPVRVVMLLWGSVIKPWLGQKQEKEPEVDDKKQKKLEKRMKRMKN